MMRDTPPTFKVFWAAGGSIREHHGDGNVHVDPADAARKADDYLRDLTAAAQRRDDHAHDYCHRLHRELREAMAAAWDYSRCARIAA